MKKSSGVTLMEIVVTLLTFAILAIICAVIYRNYITNAKIAEGMALINQIKDNEELYYNSPASNDQAPFLVISETNSYTFPQVTVADTTNPKGDVVDATNNKYFTTFAVSADAVGGTYIAEAYYRINSSNGITVSLTGSTDAAYSVNTISN